MGKWREGGKTSLCPEETEEHKDGRFCVDGIALEASGDLADTIWSSLMTSSSIIVENDWRMW